MDSDESPVDPFRKSGKLARSPVRPRTSSVPEIRVLVQEAESSDGALRESKKRISPPVALSKKKPHEVDNSDDEDSSTSDDPESTGSSGDYRLKLERIKKIGS